MASSGIDPALEGAATLIGAVRDLAPVVRLTYRTLRMHTSRACSVLVADNGGDAEATAFLAAQDWLRLFTLQERRVAADTQHQASADALTALRNRLAESGPLLTVDEERLLARMMAAVRPAPAPSTEELAQHAPALDWLIALVSTEYTVAIDADVEFRHSGWLSDLIKFMDRNRIDLAGFLEPARHPLQERFATYVLAMRTDSIRELNISFEPELTFDDPVAATAWYGVQHHPKLDTTAFAAFPSARFYDTGALIYREARARDLRCVAFPHAWHDRFRHLGHMSWSGDIPTDYAGAAELRRHRDRAAAYAEKRCRELVLGDAE